jgi:signal transduction histidine kinase
LTMLSPLSTDAILATTAHELRLPLSHIKRYVSTLRRTDIEWNDEALSEFLAKMDMEADRLTDLIGSLSTRSPAPRPADSRGV